MTTASTASTLALLQTIRTRLLSYTPTSGPTLATLLGSTSKGAGSDGKLYLDQAPDAPSHPFGVMKLIEQHSEGDGGWYSIRGQIEVMLYHRPRAEGSTLVKHAADLIEKAWRQYADHTDGLLFAEAVQFRSTTFYDAPADREEVMERLLLPFSAVPTYLTT